MIDTLVKFLRILLSSIRKLFSALLKSFSRNVPNDRRADRFANYVDLAEANVLLKFANERAIQGVTTTNRNKLAKAIESYNQAKNSQNGFSVASINLSATYAALADQTYRSQHVNGRTIIDSQKNADFYIGTAGWIALSMVALVVWSQFFAAVASRDNPVYQYADFLLAFQPLLWGAIGGAVYVIRTVSRAARHCQFDTRNVDNSYILILLGAILGFAITKLVLVSDWPNTLLGENGIPLTFTESGVAFVGGFGSKVVFSFFESVIYWMTNVVRVQTVRK